MDSTRRPRHLASSYMHWVKTLGSVRYGLVTSGLLFCPLSFLESSPSELEINGPSFYGYEPLRRAVASHSGVDPSSVVLAQGTSMANHLVMASLLQPGDEVVIEEPTYELLTDLALYCGASVRRFARRAEDRFAVNLEILSRAVTPVTRLIVLTNLHNPSSAWTDEATLREVGRMAREVGAKVLVDEVYLECLSGRSVRSAFHLGEEFITTNSLTKVYGLNGLRCGWVLAEPSLAEAMWRLNDLFGVIPPHPAELLSTTAFREMPRLQERTRAHLEANWQLYHQILGNHPELDVVVPPAGTILFPRLKRGSVEILARRIRAELETAVAPGAFFGSPNHFRIGLGGPSATVKEGLTRLKHALDESFHLEK